MGKVIVEQIVSADGYAEDADGGIDFFVNASWPSSPSSSFPPRSNRPRGERTVRLKSVVPVLLGRGRSFAPSDLGPRRLSLASAQSFAGGLVVLEYDVAR